MAESLPTELELECLRLIVNAPGNFQAEIKARIRKLLLVAQSPEQAKEFVKKYLAKIQEKINKTRERRDAELQQTETREETKEPVEKKTRYEEDDG